VGEIAAPLFYATTCRHVTRPIRGGLISLLSRLHFHFCHHPQADRSLLSVHRHFFVKCVFVYDCMDVLQGRPEMVCSWSLITYRWFVICPKHWL